MEVAATVHVTLNTTENQSGRVRCPAKGTFALKSWTATTLAFTTLIVAPKAEGKITEYDGSKCPVTYITNSDEEIGNMY